MSTVHRIRAIDSHTGGEPTRVIVDGFPDLGRGPITDRLEIFRRRHDELRSAIVNEPRGHAAIVGALLCEPVGEHSDAAVIFFNNVGYLGMCGHGTIGLIKTLEYMGRIATGKLTIDTPAGLIEAALEPDGSVSITNVPSYRHAKDVSIDVPGHGQITGDIAYGGNWFFLMEQNPFKLEPEHLPELTDFAARVREALDANGVTGADRAVIDHIEVFSPSAAADSRNFVLCPGLEYDRSPCGTGTSAKLACLYADGKISEGQVWRQESIIGSVFEGKVLIDNGTIIPVIRGTAFVTAEVELILNADDPFCYGLSRTPR